MFERHQLYKHDRNTDVALEFRGYLGKDDNGTISLIVDWYNIVHTPCRVRSDQIVRISAVEISNWKPFTGDRGTYGKPTLLSTLPSR